MRQSDVFGEYENLVCGQERETALEANDPDHDICSTTVAQAEGAGTQGDSKPSHADGSSDDNDSEFE